MDAVLVSACDGCCASVCLRTCCLIGALLSLVPSSCQEKVLGDTLNDLASILAPMYKRLAPTAYNNQVSCLYTLPACHHDGLPLFLLVGCLNEATSINYCSNVAYGIVCIGTNISLVIGLLRAIHCGVCVCRSHCRRRAQSVALAMGRSGHFLVSPAAWTSVRTAITTGTT